MTIDPSALLQQLFNAGAVSQPAYGPESRYYGLPLLSCATPGGGQVSYVSRRFIPPPGAFAQLQLYRVQQGDRADAVAASLLGNPLRVRHGERLVDMKTRRGQTVAFDSELNAK